MSQELRPASRGPAVALRGLHCFPCPKVWHSRRNPSLDHVALPPQPRELEGPRETARSAQAKECRPADAKLATKVCAIEQQRRQSGGSATGQCFGSGDARRGRVSATVRPLPRDGGVSDERAGDGMGGVGHGDAEPAQLLFGFGGGGVVAAFNGSLKASEPA